MSDVDRTSLHPVWQERQPPVRGPAIKVISMAEGYVRATHFQYQLVMAVLEPKKARTILLQFKENRVTGQALD